MTGLYCIVHAYCIVVLCACIVCGLESSHFGVSLGDGRDPPFAPWTCQTQGTLKCISLKCNICAIDLHNLYVRARVLSCRTWLQKTLKSSGPAMPGRPIRPGCASALSETRASTFTRRGMGAAPTAGEAVGVQRDCISGCLISYRSLNIVILTSTRRQVRFEIPSCCVRFHKGMDAMGSGTHCRTASSLMLINK